MEDEFYVFNAHDLDLPMDAVNCFQKEPARKKAFDDMIGVAKRGIDSEFKITYLLDKGYDAFNEKYYKIIDLIDSYSDYFQREDVIETVALLDDEKRKKVYLNSNNYESFKENLKRLEYEESKVPVRTIVMISDACIAYERTDNYQEFEKYYQENANVKEEDARKKFEARFVRHRAYLNASTVDEFRENLESEYGKTPLKSDSKVLTRKK